MNEVTFVAKLGAFTAVRASAAKSSGTTVLIAQGNVEEAQRDASGSVKRCDMRLSSASGRKLVSGEMKRPELAEGRDPRNIRLVADARNKAVSRGLPLYFTCNMANVVVWEVSLHSGIPDRELGEFTLAPITRSSQVHAYLDDIEVQWSHVLDELERHLTAIAGGAPAPTNYDVLRLQSAIGGISEEALSRAERYLTGDPSALRAAREESAATFGFPFPLDPKFKSDFRQDLDQVLRLSAFVVAQKLILYRVLMETGRRLPQPFMLDDIDLPRATTDPGGVRGIIHRGVAQAITRSGDYETAFLPTPNEELLFIDPQTSEEIAECRVGTVWVALLDAISGASWSAISHNLIGFLYEAIVDPEYRHALGQHYTHENVVDFLATFAVRSKTDAVLDPAAGGGSFLRSAYGRKRELRATHRDALAEVWGCELSSFAAELSTVTLATADPAEPSAYPRVVVMDFFDLRPKLKTKLHVPDVAGPLRVPAHFDAVIGNPPYISYRHQTNQQAILRALSDLPDNITLPRLSGKSDEYAWFLIHATRFLREGGRLGFVVSSAILFSDYGVPLVRFLARHYKIRAVVDSMVERWFVDADTNTVLLLLEREAVQDQRVENDIRFVRFRRPLAQLLPAPLTADRRDRLETLVDVVLNAPVGDDDPRFTCVSTRQGDHGGIVFIEGDNHAPSLLDDDDDEEED